MRVNMTTEMTYDVFECPMCGLLMSSEAMADKLTDPCPGCGQTEIGNALLTDMHAHPENKFISDLSPGAEPFEPAHSLRS